jgi:hypothetical protein
MNLPPSYRPLTLDENEGIISAVNSTFRKLKNLYVKVGPIFEDFGFTPPSAGVIARDLSEKIEKAIVQHCGSFTKGNGHCDLCRHERDWEVKICKGAGLTINQSKIVNGENYIVVNYAEGSVIRFIWILWAAQDAFFSPRIRRSNARSLVRSAASENIQLLFSSVRQSLPMTPQDRLARLEKRAASLRRQISGLSS